MSSWSPARSRLGSPLTWSVPWSIAPPFSSTWVELSTAKTSVGPTKGWPALLAFVTRMVIVLAVVASTDALRSREPLGRPSCSCSWRSFRVKRAGFDLQEAASVRSLRSRREDPSDGNKPGRSATVSPRIRAPCQGRSEGWGRASPCRHEEAQQPLLWRSAGSLTRIPERPASSPLALTVRAASAEFKSEVGRLAAGRPLLLGGKSRWGGQCERGPPPMGAVPSNRSSAGSRQVRPRTGEAWAGVHRRYRHSTPSLVSCWPRHRRPRRRRSDRPPPPLVS